MRFAHAQLLWFLAVLPVLGLFALWRLRAGRRALARTLGPLMAERLTRHLSAHAREARLALALLALAFLVLGGARPQRGTQYVSAKRMGGDVLFALDVSESMLAEDLKPNRLQRARHEISAILDRLKGDRVALVAFAGEAFLQCPLTLDYSAARMFLDYMTPDLIPQPGTNLAAALRTAVRAFSKEGEGVRAVVLITDGEDHEGDIDAAAREAHDAGVRVFAVGIGSSAGEPIPVRDGTGTIKGYKKDRSGTVVLSRLDEAVLRRIAEETDGVYVQAGGTLGLRRVTDAIEGIQQREFEGGMRVLYEERYRYFVWPALVLLLLESAVPLRRDALRRLLARARRVPALSAVAGLAFALQAGWIGPAPARAQTASRPAISPGPAGSPGSAMPGGAGVGADARAQERWRALYEENEVFHTRHPGDPRPLYNLGNLLHEQGDLEQAAARYRDASALAEGELRGNSSYNLGNTLFKKQDLAAARDAFLDALRTDPGNENAKRNLELTQWLLDRAQQADSSSQEQQGSDKNQKQDQQQNQQEKRDQGGNEEQQKKDEAQRQAGDQDQQRRQDQAHSEEQQRQGQQEEQRAQQEQQQQQQQQQQQSGQGEDQQMGQEQPLDETQGAEADSSGSLERIQARQLLRGLEGRERELLEQRFHARSRRLNVEKDW